jgi:hypothetical protein
MVRAIEALVAMTAVPVSSGLAMPATSTVLEATQLAAIVGGSAASDLACGFLAGVSVGSGLAGLFGCGPCGLVSLGASALGLLCL